MSDFSDRPFVAGSLTGVRSFRVDSLGRLAGPTYPQVFTPGETLAICRVSPIDRAMRAQIYSVAAFTGVAGPAPEEPGEHHVAQRSCGCGFYAYYDNGHNPHHHAGQVLGLIEGYG